MKETYEFILNRLNKGVDCALLEIIASQGSSPRHAGSIMAISRDGSTSGSIGGGRTEYLALEDAKKSILEKSSMIKHYELVLSDTWDALNAACGGSIDVKIIYLAPTKENIHMYSMLLLEATQIVPKAYVFGGGHISKAVVPVLHSLGFYVIVADCVEAFTASEDFPDAQRVISAPFENSFLMKDVTLKDFILIMTRGHEYDYTVLKQALKTDACYIGMVGSRTKVKILHDRLLQEGFTDEDFARVHTPVGLKINAETPQEIAISIAAEMIQVKNQE